MGKLLLLIVGIGIGTYYSDRIKDAVNDVTNGGENNG